MRRNSLFALVSWLTYVSFATIAYGQENGRVLSGDLVVVFNQPQYAPGDTAFFSAFLPGEAGVQAQTKMIAGVRLVDASLNQVRYQRILFEGGFATGLIAFPVKMESGHYDLVFCMETPNRAGELVSYQSRFFVRGGIVMARGLLDNANDSTMPLEIQMDSLRYHTRGQVRFQFASTTNTGIVPLALTVYNSDLFRSDEQVRPPAPLVLVISPTVHVANQAQMVPFFFRGRVVDHAGGVISEGSTVSFYLFQDDLTFSVPVRKGGEFSFPLLRPFESQGVFFRVMRNGKKIRHSKIELFDDCHLKLGSAPEAYAGKTSTEYGRYAAQTRLINKSYRYFLTDRSNATKSFAYDSPAADHVVLIEKYEQFKSMGELIRNVVPMVKCIDGQDPKVRIFLKDKAYYAEDDPVFIIDGRMTDNLSYVLSLDPATIKEISVMRSDRYLRRFGDLGLNGVLFIRTTGFPEEIDAANTLYVTGVDRPIKQILDLQEPAESAPWLRSSLLWQPFPDLDDGHTYTLRTADNQGKHVVHFLAIMGDRICIAIREFFVEPR